MVDASSVHRADGDCLLALAMLLHVVQQFLLCPRWDRFVGIADLSTFVKCSKGWKVALLWVSVIGPVGWSDLALHEDQLCTADIGTVAKCMGDENFSSKR